jgi:NAD(P)-dependent dehydrogenase (short-subunit alcohol dehydrogenase family)
MSRLDGKVAIVTGGARGIGRAIADAMAGEGASVVIGDISRDGAAEAASGIEAAGEAAISVPVDVSVRSQVEGLVSAAEDAFGTPTVLVCSAGITTGGGVTTFLELSDDEWTRVFDVNLRGTFLCSQVVARRMAAGGTGGSIITVTSIGATRPMFGVPAYHTSKAAVSGLTRAMAVNLAHHGIRANALAPGYIMTDMMRSVLGDAERYEALVSRVPSSRLGEPGDLVGAAVFLASDEAAYITGHVLNVDGGAYVLGWTSAQSPVHSDDTEGE